MEMAINSSSGENSGTTSILDTGAFSRKLNPGSPRVGFEVEFRDSQAVSKNCTVLLRELGHQFMITRVREIVGREDIILEKLHRSMR